MVKLKRKSYFLKIFFFCILFFVVLSYHFINILCPKKIWKRTYCTIEGILFFKFRITHASLVLAGSFHCTNNRLCYGVLVIKAKTFYMDRNATWLAQILHNFLVFGTRPFQYTWQAVQYAWWALLCIFFLVHRNFLDVVSLNKLVQDVLLLSRWQRRKQAHTHTPLWCLSLTLEQYSRQNYVKTKKKGFKKKEKEDQMISSHDWTINKCGYMTITWTATAPYLHLLLVLKALSLSSDFPLSFLPALEPDYLVPCHPFCQFHFPLPVEPPPQQLKNRLIMS